MGLVVQRVVLPDGEVSWTVLDAEHAVVGPVDRFLAHLTSVGRSPTTVRSYAFDLRDLFAFLAQGEVAWDALRLEDLGRFVSWLDQSPAERAGNITRLPRAGSHCSASTINRTLAAVGSFYEFHQRHGVECEFLWSLRRGGAWTGSWRPLLAHLGGESPRRKEIKLKAPKRTPRTLTAEQVVAVAKSGPREVPVAAGVLRLYADYLFDEYGALDSDYVFVNLWAGSVGAPMSYWSAIDLVARLRDRTGVMFTPHWFRHTYATELLRRQVPAEVVQKLLGHASVATTIDTYEHLEIEHLRTVLQDAGWLTDVQTLTGAGS